MAHVEIVPWFLMSASLALILIAPLLSDGPPQPPSPDRYGRR